MLTANCIRISHIINFCQTKLNTVQFCCTNTAVSINQHIQIRTSIFISCKWNNIRPFFKSARIQSTTKSSSVIIFNTDFITDTSIIFNDSTQAIRFVYCNIIGKLVSKRNCSAIRRNGSCIIFSFRHECTKRIFFVKFRRAEHACQFRHWIASIGCINPVRFNRFRSTYIFLK